MSATTWNTIPVRAGLGLLVAVSLALSACGGNNDSPNLCEDVTCERGVCEAASGECINAVDCGGDTSQCLTGYTCTNNSCRADVPCNEDDTCARGTCEAGACVDTPMCADTSECLAGNYCNEGTCEEDPCDENTCDRGVCEEGSSDCINPMMCEADIDCLTDFKCIEGTCTDEATFCADNPCDRGVCDFETLGCVNAQDCSVDENGNDLNDTEADQQCLEGNYCDGGACQVNECDEDMVMCDRGVCDRASGVCVSADPCNAPDECVDGELCIMNTCTPDQEARDAVECPGNQVKEYDEENLEVVCAEDPEGCGNAIDCLGDRVCDAGACADPGMCMPDALEPNDDAMTQTAFLSEAVSNQLRDLTLCGGNVDRFAYNVDEDPQTEGLLLVDVQLDPADVGLGTVAVRVLGPTGFPVTTERTNVDIDGNPTNRIRIEDVVVGAMDSGEYIVEVEGTGLNTQGIRYSMTVDLLDAGVLTACEMPTTLAPNSAVPGDFSQAPAQALTSTCFDDAGQAGDLVYQIDLQERSYVTLLAQGAADVALSVRQACSSDISEHPNGCSAEAGAGQTEELGLPLDAGTHFIVAQNQGGDGTNFTLSYTAQPITCEPAVTNQCLDSDVSRQCNDTLTGVREVTCEFGCNSMTGVCDDQLGNSCVNPFVVDPAVGVSTTVDRPSFRNTFDPGNAGCVPSNSSSADTDGPDMVYEVFVDVDRVLTAQIEDTSFDDLTVYLLDDCQNVDSCLVGVNDNTGSGDESLFWRNDTGMAKTVYLVVDGEDGSFIDPIGVDIQVRDFICTPGSARCGTANRESQVCNDTGTAYDSTIVCGEGDCDPMTGRCSADGNTCSGALTLTSGVTVSGEVANLTDDYQEDCGISTASGSATQGPDAVYVLENVQAGDIIDVEAFFSYDGIVYIAQNCDIATNSLGACIEGADDQTANGPETESFFITAPSAGDYYIVLDVADVGTPSGDPNGPDFTVRADVGTPNCMPGQIFGCNMAGDGIEGCSDRGLTISQTCSSGTCDAVTNRCASPNGDTCVEAAPVTSGQTVTGELSDFTDTSTQNCGDSGANGTGNDATYVLQNVQQGDRVKVTSTYAYDGFILVGTSCGFGSGEVGSCVQQADNSESGSVSSPDGDVIEFLAPTTGDYFITVDAGDFSNPSGDPNGPDFTLTFDVSTPTCTPGAVLGCNMAGDGIEFCSEFGVEEDYICASGTCDAATGRCASPNTNNCFEAKLVTGTSGTETGTWPSGIGNDNEFDVDADAGRVDSCFFDNFGSNPTGLDQFYAVDLAAGELLTAEFRSTETDSVFYLQELCGSSTSCIGNFDTQGDNTVQYYADTAQTIYMVVDSDTTFSSSTSWTLDWKVETGFACAPDSTTCINATTARYCDASGQSFSDRACPGSCVGNSCTAEVATADICSMMVPDLGAGATLYVDPNIFSADADPGCASASGVDAFYQVQLQANDILTVDAASFGGESPSAYIFTDCTQIDTTCLQGDSGNPTTLSYQAMQAETVYIGLDNGGTFNDEGMYYQIRARQPECSSTTPLSCDASGNAIQYCEGGFFAFYQCDGGCTNGECANPTGDRCFDSISLDSATSPVSGDWSGNTNAVNTGAGLVGGCVWDSFDPPEGVDDIYSVSLAQGDLLDVTLVTDESDAQLYLLENCNDAPGTCAAYDPEEDSSSVDRTLSYYALQTGVYTVVVDREDSGTSGTYDLSWTVTSGSVCAPGEYQCLDAMTLGLCADDGNSYTAQATCPNGCAFNHCTVDTSWDTCPMAPTVGAGTFAIGVAENLNDDVDLPSSSCVGADTPGNEFFFQVDLAANEILDVTAQSIVGDTASVYIFTNCSDVEGTCVAGDEGGFNSPATASYQAGMTAETVIVGVDSSSSFDSEPFFVQVDKQVPNCTPGQYVNTCAPDGISIQFCNERGFITEYACTDTNMDGIACVNGLCDEPSGEDCFEPTEAVPGMSGTVTLTGTLADFASETDLPVGNPCTGSITPGPDPVYAVNLTMGQTLTVELTSTAMTTEDLALYITPDCDDLPQSCVAGADALGSVTMPETATYTAAGDERLYIFVDSFYGDAAGDYSLDVTVQ